MDRDRVRDVLPCRFLDAFEFDRLRAPDVLPCRFREVFELARDLLGPRDGEPAPDLRPASDFFAARGPSASLRPLPAVGVGSREVTTLRPPLPLDAELLRPPLPLEADLLRPPLPLEADLLRPPLPLEADLLRPPLMLGRLEVEPVPGSGGGVPVGGGG